MIIPQYVKSRTHCLLSITAGSSKKSKRWNALESSGRASALGLAQLLWYPRNQHLVKHLGGECAWISEKSTNSSLKQQRVDKQTDTQGNLSLIPLPKIDEMYANLCGAKVFTTLDLRSGYYHIALDQESKAKTAFVTPFGKYEFNTVPFGLAQAPAYFQQLISIVLQDCSDFAMAYLDDIIIFSQNEEDHLKHIEIIFKKLKKADLKLKESKCDFFKREIHYLGHLISVDGIQPLPEKLESIHNMPKPRSPKEIKQFLGLTGYYRKFVPRFSDMARPLTKLLAHDCEFKWTNQCDISFQMLKDTLCSAPILKYPDTSKPYTLYTDASNYGWAGVLTQSHTSSIGGKEITMDHPVSYISGLFRGSQTKLGRTYKGSLCNLHVC